MTTVYVLWGQHEDYAGGVPIKILAGPMADMREEQKRREGDGGWKLAIAESGKGCPL